MKQRNESASAWEEVSIDHEREEIIMAAAKIFMKNGYETTSMDQIAAGIGRTKGKVYYYYRTKSDILFDIHRKSMLINIRTVEPITEIQNDALTKLRLMLEAHAMLVMNHLPMQTVWVQGVERFLRGSTTPGQRQALTSLIAMRDHYEVLFLRVVEEGIDSGLLRPGPSRILVKGLLGTLNWMTFWYRPKEFETEQDRRLLCDALVGMLIDGIRSKAAPSN